MKKIMTFLYSTLMVGTCLAQNFSSLSVYLSDKDTGGPIINASIMIKEAGWISKFSDSQGKLSFTKSIPIGEIHYIVSKEGYQGQEGVFNITTEEKSNTLNIKLSKFNDNKVLISGEVTDNLGRDFEGVTVEAKFANIVKITKTDQSGNYFLEIPLNTNSYNPTQVKIEAKFNNTCKKTETVELNRTNQIYKDIKLSCEDLKPEIVEKPNIYKIEDEEYIFTFLECKKLASSIQIKLKITAKDSDRTITIFGGNNRDHSTQFFDNLNNEYKVNTIKIANNSKNWQGISQKLIQDVPTDLLLTFINVSPSPSKISLLEISLSYLGDKKIQFRNLPIK